VDDQIDDFLQEYEELADRCQLSEEVKVKKVVRYVTQSHRDFWRAMNGYLNGDWDELCQDLSEVYIDTTVQGRHSIHKLQDFVRDSART